MRSPDEAQGSEREHDDDQAKDRRKHPAERGPDKEHRCPVRRIPRATIRQPRGPEAGTASEIVVGLHRGARAGRSMTAKTGQGATTNRPRTRCAAAATTFVTGRGSRPTGPSLHRSLGRRGDAHEEADAERRGERGIQEHLGNAVISEYGMAGHGAADRLRKPGPHAERSRNPDRRLHAFDLRREPEHPDGGKRHEPEDEEQLPALLPERQPRPGERAGHAAAALRACGGEVSEHDLVEGRRPVAVPRTSQMREPSGAPKLATASGRSVDEMAWARRP